MNIVCWNIRGVGSKKKDVAVKDLISKRRCGFIGLVETKHRELREFKVKTWWGHPDVDWEDMTAIEGSGGTIASWDRSKFRRLTSKKGGRWVLIHGVLIDWGFECIILLVFAPNDRWDRKHLWDELITVKTNSPSHLPWMVMGDFNEVRGTEERAAGTSCLNSIKEFRDWSDEMMLDDIPLMGREFTWARGTSRSRLDRIFFDQEWSSKFPDASLLALANTISDHTPLSLSLINNYLLFKPFRSIDAWFSHPGFIKFVREEWRNMGSTIVTRKLKALQQPIRKWNKETFGNIDTTTKRLEKDQSRHQKKIDEGQGDECEIARIVAIETHLNIWVDRKASYQKQMARVKWIKSGDKNTWYYHAVTLGKRRSKRIE